ncbi:MAG: site-specific integrase [Oligoflexus sp.]|nr:site-specific integrase [Oligoflexus sp.]
MRVESRTDRQGKEYFSFTFMHPVTKKKTRIRKEDAPSFRTRAQAEAWAQSQDAHYEAMKEAARQRAAWREAFHDWVEMADGFMAWKKDKAPASWQRSVVMIERYVLPFFLQVKSCNNANLWHTYFDEFRDWLGKEVTKVHSTDGLSYSSQNHAINSLNSLLEYLKRYNKVSPEAARKCELHPQHKLGARTVEDVYSEEEVISYEKALRKTSELTADFFYVLSKTGMRFNELYSLPISQLFKGQMTGPVHDELKEKGVEYVGYILLDSQILKEESDSLSRNRLPDHSHRRGPLKGRKDTNIKNARFIPIIDKDCWNILVRLYQEQKKSLDRDLFGSNAKNYLFFEDVEEGAIRRHMQKANEALGTHKDFHSLRHTYSTRLAGKTRSFFLCKVILGHKTEKEFDKYCHIFEETQLEAKKNSQVIDFM